MKKQVLLKQDNNNIDNSNNNNSNDQDTAVKHWAFITVKKFSCSILQFKQYKTVKNSQK